MFLIGKELKRDKQLRKSLRVGEIRCCTRRAGSGSTLLTGISLDWKLGSVDADSGLWGHCQHFWSGGVSLLGICYQFVLTQWGREPSSLTVTFVLYCFGKDIWNNAYSLGPTFKRDIESSRKHFSKTTQKEANAVVQKPEAPLSPAFCRAV